MQHLFLKRSFLVKKPANKYIITNVTLLINTFKERTFNDFHVQNAKANTNFYSEFGLLVFLVVLYIALPWITTGYLMHYHVFYHICKIFCTVFVR